MDGKRHICCVGAVVVSQSYGNELVFSLPKNRYECYYNWPSIYFIFYRSSVSYYAHVYVHRKILIDKVHAANKRSNKSFFQLVLYIYNVNFEGVIRFPLPPYFIHDIFKAYVIRTNKALNIGQLDNTVPK